jgi:type II secretory pathway predicted ATPase ExeA
MNALDHLDPAMQPLLDLPQAERAGRMLVDRFISHGRVAPILDHVEFLRLQPQQTRAAGLVVSGRPGSGKTMLARAVVRRCPPKAAEGGQTATWPALSINMTGAREAKTLYNRILSQLEVPDPGRYAGSDRERMVLKVCRAAGVRLLIVDEIQDILTSTARQQRIALDTIKFLMNELSLPILALGTGQAREAMQVDEHLNARFTYRDLPIWKQDQHLTTFLDALERVLPLREPSHLSSLPMSSTILRHSEGVLDVIVRLVTHAAAHAVEQGKEAVTPALIELAFNVPPVAAVRPGITTPVLAQAA